MFASSGTSKQTLPICVLQVVGLTAPAVYSSQHFSYHPLRYSGVDILGLTFAYSYMVIPPIATYAPPEILAKQWLQAYQYAANFVPPLVLSGTFTNALLAYFAKGIKLRLLYGIAAVSIWSIVPVTLLYFEPNVNGAGKWKVQEILKDEGYTMKENYRIVPYVDVHTAKPEARKWAEKASMREIAILWADLNAWRYRVTAAAVLASAVATCNW